MLAHVSTCRHISAHVGMSICADTCQHADKLQRVRIRDAEGDGTCWHMSAHISTCRHVSADVGMSTCADTYQHGGKVQMVGIRDVGTCRHISAHVGMSKCADTCQHADNVQMVCIKEADSDGTCWHMSAHISTCRHMPAHVGMSKCADTCQHAGKIQMVCIRGAESDAICWHISAHVGPYQHMSAHIGTCRHISAHVSMSTCAGICQHADKIQIIGIIGTENDVTFRHMSAHVSTCRHVTRCRRMPTCAGTYVLTSWLWHSLQNSTLVEYDRGENGRNIEASFTLPDGSSVPSMNNMQLLSIPERKKIYNKGMGIEREPHSALSDLHFLLSVIAFWVRNTHPNLIHIYALWLSVLKLNVISQIANMKGGPGTSTKASPTGTSAAASGRYLTHGMLENMPSTSGAVGKGTGDLISLGALKKQCSKTPVDCERAAERMAVFETEERIFGHNSPDRTHLHAFAQFQAIYRAALDFNSVLNQPYHSNVASRVFQGKFLYNISVKLDKCTDPLNEILVMLGRDNRLANWFQKSIAYIQNWFRGKETILNPPHDREDDDTEDFDELVRSSDQKQGAYKLTPRKRQKLVPWNKEMSRNTFTN